MGILLAILMNFGIFTGNANVQTYSVNNDGNPVHINTAGNADMGVIVDINEL